MILGCQILHLLYTNQELNRADGVAKQFATAFKNKLASAVDEPDLILEWGIAAILTLDKSSLANFATYLTQRAELSGCTKPLHIGIPTKSL